jgi:hypothetical protein
VKRNWNEEELIEHFTLLPDELYLAMGNKIEGNRLGFAVLLKYFQQEARFPYKKQDIPKVVMEYIAKHQVGYFCHPLEKTEYRIF